MENCAEIRGLCVSFNGEEVLHGITTDIPRHGITVLLGRSGSGKTTLLRALNRLNESFAGYVGTGTVRLAIGGGMKPVYGSEAPDLTRIRRSVGMVFQSYNLFPNKNLLQNIMLAPMVVKGMKKDEAHELGMKMLEKVGLKGFAQKYPSTLSGGQSQRAAIARALAMNPRVMLYDEPTSALDPELVGEVLQVMKDLDAEGMTQIIVTHEMKFAKDASDYIIFMDKGEIVGYEDGDILFANPKNDRTRAFLRHFVNAGVTC